VVLVAACHVAEAAGLSTPQAPEQLGSDSSRRLGSRFNDQRTSTLPIARRSPSSKTRRLTAVRLGQSRQIHNLDTFGWRGLAASRLGGGPSARREHCWRHRLFDLFRVPDDLNRLGWAVVLRTAISK